MFGQGYDHPPPSLVKDQTISVFSRVGFPKVVHGTGQVTKRDNEDTSHDMGRNRVYENTREDETTQRVKTGSDIKSPIDRIEESCPHHLDCIQQGHFDDIYDASQSHEVRPSQTKAASPVKRHRHNNSVSKKEQWDVDDIITHFVNKAYLLE